jgi:hypothetical protein
VHPRSATQSGSIEQARGTSWSQPLGPASAPTAAAMHDWQSLPLFPGGLAQMPVAHAALQWAASQMHATVAFSMVVAPAR